MRSKDKPGYLKKARRRVAKLYRGLAAHALDVRLDRGGRAAAPLQPGPARRLAQIQERLNAGVEDHQLTELRGQYRTLIEEHADKRELYDFALRNEALFQGESAGFIDALLFGFRHGADLSANAYATLLTRLLSASRLAEGADIAKAARQAFPDNPTIVILGFMILRRLDQLRAVWSFALGDMSPTLFGEPGVRAELRQTILAARQDPALLDLLRADVEACADSRKAGALQAMMDLVVLDDPEAAYARLASEDIRLGDTLLAVETVRALATRRSFEKAADLSRRFTEAHGPQPQLLSTRAECLLALGRPAEAEPILIELASNAALRPGLTVDLWLVLARAGNEAIRAAGFADKVELLRAALGTFPGDSRLLGEKFIAEIAAGRRRTSFLAVPDQGFDEFARQAELNYRPLSMHVSYYERLLLELADMRDTAIVPVKDLLHKQGARHTIALRHDIDAKPDAAVSLARLNARYGIASTFYLLHSSPYYGAFNGFLFARNPRLRHWIDALLVAGCEIGLHNDALGIEARTGISAAEVVGTEIGWLRSQGAEIHGTVAHNSFASQAAENFEVFSELVMWRRELRGQTGEIIQLGQLSMASLGLSYEGNFPVRPDKVDKAAVASFSGIADAGPRNGGWMKAYLLDNPCMKRSHGCDIWLVDIDRWVVCDREIGYFNANLRLDELDGYFGLEQRASRVLFTLHPDYFYSF
jgi:hypothetical protein